MWWSSTSSNISVRLIHGSKWSLERTVNYQRMQTFMYLCSHVTNRGLILPKLKEKIKCSWRKILTGLRIITGTICFIGSWPQIFSLYLSLSLSICLWIFFHNFTLLFSTVVSSQSLSFTDMLWQGFPQLDSKLCKELPACIHF